MELTLQTWSQCEKECIEKQSNGCLLIQNVPLVKKLDQENRSGLKVSIKIFAYSESCSTFTDAIRLILSSLGTDYIDSLVLALPPDRQKGSIETMKSIWTCAVTNVINGTIRDLGVSDLDASQLQQLYDWAEAIKPSTNQVNLEACCVIPPELNEFAKLKNIRLLTHNDPRDILPADKLHSLLSAVSFPDSDSYKCSWIARYSVLITGSGVIESKGYFVAIQKE